MNPVSDEVVESATAKRPKPKAAYIPILGELLGIAVKSVIPQNTFFYEEKCDGSWVEPNKETGAPETHLYHSGSSLGKDVRTDQEVAIVFEHPAQNPLRTTVHLNRNSIPMAAARMNESEPFGLSLQNQHYLNLVYTSEQKPAGFEPVFIKSQLPNMNPIYIRISIAKQGNSERTFLMIVAKLIQESEAPTHLVACNLSEPKRQSRMQLSDSLRKRYLTH